MHSAIYLECTQQTMLSLLYVRSNSALISLQEFSRFQLCACCYNLCFDPANKMKITPRKQKFMKSPQKIVTYKYLTLHEHA